MKLNKVMIAALAALSLSGCASIVGETDQGVTINSTPSKADVVITDESSKEVFAGSTPTTVQLSKSDGSYFGGKTYTVEISKNGYENRTLMIQSSPNGWYVAGNLVFGGFIGWLIVDPMTGAMYNLSPDAIDASLGEEVATSDNGDKEINLVLLQDVPAQMRDKMEVIGQI